MVDAIPFAVDVALDVTAVTRRRLRWWLHIASRRRRFVALAAPIDLGRSEAAAPNAAFRRTRLVLFVDVIAAVAPIGDRESGPRHLRRKVCGAAAANGHLAAVVVDVALRAGDGAVADQAAQLARGFVA